MEEKTLAMEIIEDYKKDKKRLFIALIIVICLWFVTIGGFMYYIATTDYETTIKTANTEGNGNACIGSNCNNGVLNGDSDSNN